MALFSKVGGTLKQTLSNHINKEIASTPSIYQVIRCMSSKLFIGGLSFSTDETSLREVCSKYGDVLEVRIILDRETSRSRGFGFVTYESSEAAASAIQALDQQELHGRRLRVNYANDRTRGYTGGGGGYGGSYGGVGYGGGNYGGGSSYGGGNSEGYGTAGGYGGNFGTGNYGGGGAYGGGNNEGYGTTGSDSNFGTGNYGGGNTAEYTAPVADNYTSSGGSFNSTRSYTGTGGGYGGSSGSGFGSGGQFPSGNDYVKGDQNFGVTSGGGGSDNMAFADNAFDQNQGFSPDGGDQFGEGGKNNTENDQDDNDPQDYADRRA